MLDRIETCSYCGITDKPEGPALIMSRSRLRKKTLETMDSLSVKLPACPKCMNSAVSGRSPSTMESPAKMLMYASQKINSGLKKFISKASIKEIKIRLREIDEISYQFDAVWLGMQMHVDYIDKLPDRAKRHARMVLCKDVHWMNIAASFLQNSRRLISQVIEVDYDEARRAADAFIRKEWVRNYVFQKDGWKCRKCKSSAKLAIDHIISVIRGGKSELSNLQTLCASCNAKKGQ